MICNQSMSHIYLKVICVSPFLNDVLDERLEDLKHKMCCQTNIYINQGSSQEELAHLTETSLKIIRKLLK